MTNKYKEIEKLAELIGSKQERAGYNIETKKSAPYITYSFTLMQLQSFAKALLEAAPPADVEPVAYIRPDFRGNGYAELAHTQRWKFSPTIVKHEAIPLYTQPPADKDAERYRWLKSKAWTISNYDYGAGYDYVMRFYKSSENIDEAIDKAMGEV